MQRGKTREVASTHAPLMAHVSNIRHGCGPHYPTPRQSKVTRQSNIEPKPQRNHLPHPLSLLLCPGLQRPCACLTFSLLGASTRTSQTVDTQRLTQIVQRLTELLRDVERIRASTLMVKEIVLRSERHELREIAFASPVGVMTMRIWIMRVVCKGVSWTGH